MKNRYTYIYALIIGFITLFITPIFSSDKAFAGFEWKMIQSPNSTASGNLNYIQGMDSTSSTDSWAVGINFNSGSTNVPQAFIQNSSDGETWVITRDQGMGVSSALYGIAAITPNDVWAVGIEGEVSFLHMLIL